MYAVVVMEYQALQQISLHRFYNHAMHEFISWAQKIDPDLSYEAAKDYALSSGAFHKDGDIWVYMEEIKEVVQ